MKHSWLLLLIPAVAVASIDTNKLVFREEQIMKKLWLLLLLPVLALGSYTADPWIITDITATSVDYAMDGSETFVGCNTTDSSLIITLPPI